MTFYVAKVPLPEKNPSDFLRYGCEVTQDSNDHWPLHVYVDLRDLPPDKMADNSCEQNHSWCDLYSMQPTRIKALKDCDKWMRELKKEFKKAK